MEDEVTASLDDLPLRDDLRGLTPYGAPQAPLPIALNVNENTHPIPDEVASDILDEISVAIRDVNRYPDREFTALREGFAEYLGHGLEADGIWAGNGSTRCCSASCRPSEVRDAPPSGSHRRTRCIR